MINPPPAIAAKRPGAVVPPAKVSPFGRELPKHIGKPEIKNCLLQGLPFYLRGHHLFFTALGIMACIWMVNDARARGQNAWPFVALTLALGSFGPLLYLALRELRQPAPRAV